MKESIKEKVRLAFFILLYIEILCVLFAMIYELFLQYQTFVFVIGSEVKIFVLHWSAWLYLAVIPLLMQSAVLKFWGRDIL